MSTFTPVDTAASALEAACARLRSAGLRITQPRVAILQVLLARSSPASIEQIHGALSSASCDLVTVYRCLAAFQKAGLVRLCYFHNGTSLYEIAMNRETAFHIVSRESNGSTPLPADLTSQLREVLRKIEASLQARGFRDVSSVVNFVASTAKAVQPKSRTEGPAIPALP